MERGRFWNPEMETLATEARERLQEQRLMARLASIVERADLVREQWRAAGLEPGSIRTLEAFRAHVPAIDKDMVRRYREAHGDPFGGMSILRPGAEFDIHSSSGTTGAPTFLPITDQDVSTFAESLARHYWAMGLRPGDVASLAMGLYLRPVRALHLAARRIGARPVLSDWQDIPRLVHTFRHLRPRLHIFLSPPQAVGLQAEIERMGLSPREVCGQVPVFVWAGDSLTPRGRQLVDDEWGSEVFELSGQGDLCFMMAECEAHDGLHAHDDLWMVEAVEPGTTRPVAEGERGEFLFTSLLDHSLAFVRWRSEDMGYLTREPCACGRTTTRLWFLGRTGYRVSVRGRSLFPVEVQRVLETEPETAHGVFQIVRSAPDMERLQIRLGAEPGRLASPEPLVGSLSALLERELGLPVRIELVPMEALLALGPPHKVPRIHEPG